MKSSTPKRSEVDIRVSQELKNHQDFIYQTNQSLQNLSKSLIGLSLMVEKLQAKQGSDHKQLEIFVEKQADSLWKTTSHQDEEIIKLNNHVSDVFNRVDERIKEFTSSLVAILDLSMHVDAATRKSIEVEKQMEVFKNFFDSCLRDLKASLEGQISSLRKDLTPAKVEGDPIKEAIAEEMKPYRVDFDGLYQEIAHLKKAVNYGEKKFENIYTLIDRLKAGS